MICFLKVMMKYNMRDRVPGKPMETSTISVSMRNKLSHCLTTDIVRLLLLQLILILSEMLCHIILGLTI